ncbi:acyl carrier protein [Sphaerisporangium album]|uniref:Acyl carrier protein n=1 Tax=Sphaerisporangium album TaxID=509200 RepID=A0A367FA76_9ACTN|nr:acyl carrier protein [Sphaerisporangium album]RCG27286.1 acyl carrier protein [Sphaerisporangium album]
MNISETSDELVAQVRKAWADVLGTDSAESVPLDVNFLEAGGNSLLLVMLWEELQPLAVRPVKLSELFQHGTVRAQADLLADKPAAAEPTATERPVAAESGQRSLLAARRAAATPAGGGRL